MCNDLPAGTLPAAHGLLHETQLEQEGMLHEARAADVLALRRSRIVAGGQRMRCTRNYARKPPDRVRLV